MLSGSRSTDINSVRFSRSARSPFAISALGLPLGLLLGLIAGCGGGGSGTRGAAVTPPPVEISQVMITPDPSGTLITFNVVSPENDPVDVAIQYSDNRGDSYRDATITGLDLEALPAKSDGTDFQAKWIPTADLADLAQADFRIRVIPTNSETGQLGDAQDSATFALGDNLPPVVETATTPVGTQGGSVTLSYEVRDSSADHVGIELSVSTDGGVQWVAATTAEGGDGFDSVSTGVTAVTRSVVWDAQADLDSTVTSAMIRITPFDVIAGTPAQTGAISLNLKAPTITLLSVGQIDEDMNGSQSYLSDSGATVSFHVSVPRSGFRITVDYAASPTGGAIDPNSLTVSSDLPFGSIPAGTNLASSFTADSTQALWDVPSSAETSLGSLTLTARVADQYGNLSPEVTFTTTVVTADGLYRPFEITDKWHLNFETDLFTTTFTGGATLAISSSLGANGVADFLEDLALLGLQTDSPTAACATLGTNSILANWATTETLGRLNELFGRDFDGTGSGFHSNLQFSSDGSGARSAIRIGGDDANPGFTLGRAQFDYRNVSGNSDTSSTLGVFVTNMIQFYVNASFTFRNRFDPLIEGRGVPAGEDAVDHIVLAPGFDRLAPGNTVSENTRYDQIQYAIDGLARSIAVIAAHEIGHSIGLCANGPPPGGLFGGVNDAPFAGAYTTDYHFDSSGNNIMAAALSFSTSLITGANGYQFNELNEAYLREWIILQE